MKKYWLFILLAIITVLTFGYFLFVYLYAPTDLISYVNTATPSLPASKPKPPDKQWSLIATGDIMLGREVDARMDRNGRDYPFLETKDVLSTADIAFGNFEAPFSESDSNHDSGSMNLTSEVDSVEGLKTAGFDILNLASNHFDNGGQAGELLTMQVLRDNGIAYTGAGENYAAAHKAAIIKVGKIDIAFLGYNDRDVASASSFATDSRPGTAAMDIPEMQTDINNTKAIADYLIVSMHSGTEYTPNPNSRQIEFAHAAIDAGADLILGHHPHVVQATEKYKDKNIFYSLGNFVFDQPWSTETQQGIMVKFNFTNAKLIDYELMPMRIKDWCQPYILPAGEEYDTIINRINQASEKLLEQNGTRS